MRCRFYFLITLIFLVAVIGCGRTKELPQVFLLRANVFDECLTVLREALHSDEFWPSVYAAEALIDAGYGFDARPVVTQKLDEEEDPVYRAALARALLRGGRKEAIVLLQDILLGADEPAKLEAMKGMFYIGAVADTSIIHDALRHSDNEPLKVYAWALLHIVEDAKTEHYVREALNDSDSALRIAAVDIIPVIGSSEQDTSSLLINLQNASTDFERFYTIRALSMLDHVKARQTLPSFTKHKDPTIRQGAAYAIAESWMVNQIDLLYTLLKDPSRSVRVRAAQALLTLNDADSVYRYMRIRS